MLKIGLISYHSFSQPGGVKNHVLALYQEFKKRGYPTKIIVPRRKIPENYGKDVILLGTSVPTPFNGSQSDFSISLNTGTIEKLLKKEKFDILHFHNCGPITYQVVERSKALNIFTFHSCNTIKRLEANPWFKLLPAMHFLKKGVQKMDGLIGIAPFNVGLIRKIGYQGPAAVIPNGIYLDKFNFKTSKIKKYRDGKINLLFVGRIEERKGLIYLLKAYKILKKKFPNIRLIVVGKGEMEERCQDFARKQKLKDVIFEGEVKESEIPHYYSTCDIFVAPGIFGESFGIVLLEAMASGCPIVAFANRGYKRVLKGKGGEFLVKPKDWQRLAKKIEILIKDKAKRKEMGEWGLKEAQKYSWDKICDQVLDFYKLCLRKQKPKRKIKSFDKIFNKMYNKNILNWLKQPK